MDDGNSSTASTDPTASAKNAKIYEEMQQLKQQLEEKDAIITQLQQHILTLETELPLQNKKRRLDNDDWEQQAIDNKDMEIERLTKENEQLKQKPGSWAETEVEDSLGIPGIHQMDAQIKQNDDLQTRKIIKIIEDKMNNGFEKIQENVEKLINDKLNNAPCPDQPKPTNEITTGINQPHTYAHTVGNQRPGPVRDLRTIILVNKNEELAEEADRKSRTNNIIIHGKGEIGPDDDQLFAENLVKELQIGAVAIKQIERIGQKNESTKKRPLKLTLKSEEERDKFLNNLTNLKGNTLYKGISITPDFTYSERILIKEFQEKAKIKNTAEGENETNYVWRVRGTPKNGLFLKRFTKVTQSN